MRGTLNYTIRKLKSGKASIQVVHGFGRGNEVQYSIGIHIDPSHWNKNRQRVRNILAEPNFHKINKTLDKYVVQLTKGLEDLYFEKPNYTNKDVRNIFDIIFGRVKVVKKTIPTLMECYNWYIEYFSSNPNPTTKKPFSDGTIRSFKTSQRVFERYSKLIGGIDYKDVSMELYEDFVNHLQAQNYSNNYIANHIKNLKTILNYSFSRGYHTNTTHKRREFAKPRESVDSIYLTIEELERLEKLKLSPGQGQSRDLFLIGAYTGLRVSDFNRLTKENLKLTNGKYFFQIESQKTSKTLLIPCHPVVIKIIEKYNFAPPPRKADQHINIDLKAIGIKAKLNADVSITKTIGGKRTTTIYKKHELLTTHTARRSFCTNAYKAGMPTLDIMTISGHQTERVFYDYIKASSLERAERIAQHPFFN